MAENSFGERVKAGRKGKKMTLQSMAEKIGTSAGYLHDLEGNKNRPGVDVLAALARALNVSTDYLLTGHDPPARLSPDELPQPRILLAESLTPEAREGLRLEDYRAVPLVEGAVAAGAARVVAEEIAGWALVWQPSVGRRANLVAVRIAGDSMEPSLPDGSLVIIDRDDRRIRPMRPFLVRLDSGATVKYVELDGQELVLIPENRTHREQRVRLEAGQESPVAGAVLWSWRAWPGAEEEPDGHGATAERRGRYRAGKAKG